MQWLPVTLEASGDGTMQDFRVQVIGEDRYEECLDFLYEHFFPHEHLAIGTGLDKRPNYAARPLYLSFLREGLSVAVVDESSGRIVAAAVNFAVRQHQPYVDYRTMPSENAVIWSFLETFEKDYDIFSEMQASQGVELCFLSVHPQFGGRGFAQRVTEGTIQVARQSGFGFIQSNPSAEAIQRVNYINLIIIIYFLFFLNFIETEKNEIFYRPLSTCLKSSASKRSII